MTWAIRCHRCEDVGVVNVLDHDYDGQAECDYGTSPWGKCDAGARNMFQLPKTSELKGARFSPQDWRLFKVKPGVPNAFAEKVAWWKERLRQSEQLWTEYKKKTL